jgi:hypothetical protein
MTAPADIDVSDALTFCTRSAPTISITNVCRVGLSAACTVPSSTGTVKIIHRRIEWVTVSTPSSSASEPSADWVPISSGRFETRSAISPPYAPSTSTGRNCVATTSPIIVPEWASSRTSHDSETDCIHVPTRLIAWPVKYSR